MVSLFRQLMSPLKEGIREAINTYADEDCLYPDMDCDSYDEEQDECCVDSEDGYKCLMKRITELGVVLKVVCPVCKGHARPNTVTYTLQEGYLVNGHSCPNCNNTGLTATEPLI